MWSARPYDIFLPRTLIQKASGIRHSGSVGLACYSTCVGPGHPFETLVTQLCSKRGSILSFQVVLERFAGIALSRLRNHQEIVGHEHAEKFREDLLTQEIKRRGVLSAVVSADFPTPGRIRFWLAWSRTPLAVPGM